MPITTSAKKAMRSSARKRVFNMRRKRAMKKAAKETRALLAEGKTAEAIALLPRAYKAIDKAKKRGIIKKNAAARTKSRLTRLVAKKSS